MLAAMTPEGVQHFHLDHLGTPRLITDGAGSEISRHTYFPFGEEANPPALELEWRKFTGHERDSNGIGSSDDLDYMHARFCSATVARFLSVDPVNSGDSKDAQSWNRYAYGRNNPIRFIDPDGQEATLALSITALGGSISIPPFLAAAGPAALIVGGGYLAYTKLHELDRYEIMEDFTVDDFTTEFIATELLGAPESFPIQAHPDLLAPILASKVPKSNVSGKEGAKDIPSWAKGERPQVGESGKEFAKRLLDRRYGEGEYKKGPGSEYNKIKKWADRSFIDPSPS